MRVRLLATAFCVAAWSAAFGWDPAGHMLIGKIAANHVKESTRASVDRLISQIDTTYNHNDRYDLITAGCWMDDMRAMPKYPWGPLHYVTIPYEPGGENFSEPAPPHVLSGIDHALATLRKPEAAESDRAEALAILIHLVGDVHQPMHCTDWNDRGGNGVLIYGVPFTDLWKRTLPNLHAYWDKAFRFEGRDGKVVEQYQMPTFETEPKSAVLKKIEEEAAKLEREFPKEKVQTLVEKMDHREWARESHRIGGTKAYPFQERPPETQVVTITPEFASQSRAIAAERVAVAGYRLARLLDELFAGK
jgi:hypothetical protein